MNFFVFACRCVNDDHHFADELPFANLDTNDPFYFLFLSGSGWRTTTTTRSLFFSLSTTLKPIHPSRKSICFVCVCVWDDLLFFVIATPTHNSADLV